MARIRYIKSEFWKDEDVAELSYQARLFYIGMWNFADKAGRLEDRPKWLKVEIFPYDNVDVNKILKDLAKRKTNSKRPFIQRYGLNGKMYIQILAWSEHQKPHHQEQESRIVEPPTLTLTETIMVNGNGECASSKLGEDAPNKHRSNTEEVLNDFNLVMGAHYRNGRTTQDLVNIRIKDGFSVEDFKVVHRKMLKKWGADDKMSQYLRPKTLYSDKFEGYLNMREPQTKLTEVGVKAYLVGQNWLESQRKQENAE